MYRGYLGRKGLELEGCPSFWERRHFWPNYDKDPKRDPNFDSSRMWGSGFSVKDLGLGVANLGFRAEGLQLGVLDFGRDSAFFLHIRFMD